MNLHFFLIPSQIWDVMHLKQWANLKQCDEDMYRIMEWPMFWRGLLLRCTDSRIHLPYRTYRINSVPFHSETSVAETSFTRVPVIFTWVQAVNLACWFSSWRSPHLQTYCCVQGLCKCITYVASHSVEKDRASGEWEGRKIKSLLASEPHAPLVSHRLLITFLTDCAHKKRFNPKRDLHSHFQNLVGPVCLNPSLQKRVTFICVNKNK
jgi:hypothetical protein